MGIFKQFKSMIERHALVDSKDRVLLGVSGGPDSICMLNLFLKFYPKNMFTIAYINHRLRKDAINEERYIREVSQKTAVPCVIESVDTKKFAKQNKLTIEEAARKLRYEKLTEMAKRLNCNKVAVAHTLNDNIETILLNLFRGTGVKGLTGIPYKRNLSSTIQLIRPMLEISRPDILNYLRKNNIKFMIDRSNYLLNFKRNFLRNKIIPVLEKEFPGFEMRIKNTAKILSDLLTFIEGMTKKYHKELITRKQQKIYVDLGKILKYNSFLQKEIIFRIIKEIGGRKTVYSRLVENICSLLDKSGWKVDLPNGWVAYAKNRKLIFSKR